MKKAMNLKKAINIKKVFLLFVLTLITAAISCTVSAETSSELAGVYEGWYYANQGQTGLTLTINDDNTGVFEFYSLPGNNNAKSGSYKVEVTKSSDGIYTVSGTEWIDDSSGYVFVTLYGTLNGGEFSGSVNNSWDFVLYKNNDSYQQIADSTYENHRYELITEGLSWENAKKSCEAMGGHLVAINSQGEQEFIENLLANADLSSSTDIWIGTARELDDFTRWVTGEPVEYSLWGRPQPDNLGGSQNYAVITNGTRGSESGSYFIEKYEWDDNSDGSRPYICEWDAWSDAAEWSTPELQKAADNNLIPDVLVGKDMTQPITRGEFAAVSVNLFEAMTGGRTVMSSNCKFSDIANNENRNYILKAFNIDVVKGYSDTEYAPDSLLQREELAAMLTRVYKKSQWPDWTLDTDDDYTINYSGVKKFDDDDLISDYAKPSVYFMVKYNVLSGIGDNKFAPKNSSQYEEAIGYANATREQAVVMSLRSFENLK